MPTGKCYSPRQHVMASPTAGGRGHAGRAQESTGVVRPQQRFDPGTLTPVTLLSLQRTIGNAAVTRLLHQQGATMRSMPERLHVPPSESTGTAIQRKVSGKEFADSGLKGRLTTAQTGVATLLVFGVSAAEQSKTLFNAAMKHIPVEDSTVATLTDKVEELEGEIARTEKTIAEYRTQLKAMEESLKGTAISAQARDNFQKRYDGFIVDMPKKPWAEFKKDLKDDFSEFGKTRVKLLAYNPAEVARLAKLAQDAKVAAAAKAAKAKAAAAAIDSMNAAQLYKAFYKQMKKLAPPTTNDTYACAGEQPPQSYSKEYVFSKLGAPAIIHIHWEAKGSHADIAKAHLKRQKDKYKTGLSSNIEEHHLKDLQIPLEGKERIKMV